MVSCGGASAALRQPEDHRLQALSAGALGVSPWAPGAGELHTEPPSAQRTSFALNSTEFK